MLDADAVIIGSGAGGLTAALSLAQAGQKVLVFEQHYLPGGWCHTFSLEGYRFSPGVHYIGGLGPKGHMRTIYEGLGVSRDLAFCEINPDGYDHVLVGDTRFDIPKGADNFADRLRDRFPLERRGITGFLTDVTAIAQELGRLARMRRIGEYVQAPFVAPTVLRWGLRSMQALVDHHISDPVLKAILLAQAGDHGQPPSLVPAAVHSSIINHYLEGAHYPLGGGTAIPRAFIRAIKKAGGKIHLSTPVVEILLEEHRAVGVRLADGREIRADNVISNADPNITFRRLIGRHRLSRRLNRKLEKVQYSVSCLSMFAATDMNLGALGMDSGNYWYYQDTDLDHIYRMGQTPRVLSAEEFPALFLTVTTLKDPTKRRDGLHTIEAFTFVPYQAFERWSGRKDGHQPKDYLALKQKAMAMMIKTVDKVVPGLADRLIFCELGTPLSNQHYLNATQGNIYGLAKSRFQVGPWAFPSKTEFEGLWLCGASTTAGHGVAGVTFSGLTVARNILGCQISDLLKQNGPKLSIYPAEDLSQWPPRLRRRVQANKTVDRPPR